MSNGSKDDPSVRCSASTFASIPRDYEAAHGAWRAAMYDARAMPASGAAPVQLCSARPSTTWTRANRTPSARSARPSKRAPRRPRVRPHPRASAGNLAAGGLSRSDLAGFAPSHQGAVNAMDAPREASIREDRATIEPGDQRDAAGPLSPRRAARAARRNRHASAVYRVRPADLDTSAGPTRPRSPRPRPHPVPAGPRPGGRRHRRPQDGQGAAPDRPRPAH